MTGLEKLNAQVKKKNSRIILGMDPDKQVHEAAKGSSLYAYYSTLIAEIAPYIAGVKPNLAFWESFEGGRETLAKLLDEARYEFGLPVILDVKRGDIGNTQEQWAKADKANFNPDIVTINPYMGWKDTIVPYLNEGIDVFALASTSNKDTEVQEMNAGGIKVYQQMALHARQADAARVGLVVGATKPESAMNIRAVELENDPVIANTSWFLAPGFGKQGGNLDFVRYAGPNAIYPISRGFTDPVQLGGLTPAEAAKKWRDTINTTAAGGYDMKPVSQIVVGLLSKYGLVDIAPSEDKATWFKLKSGGESPIYYDMRSIQSYPELTELVSYIMAEKIMRDKIEADMIVAVPYGALGLAYAVARNLGKGVLTPRKEGAKDHGKGGEIVGKSLASDKILIVEDVATTGKSTLETLEVLNGNERAASDSIVLLDRQQGASANLDDRSVKLHSVFTQDDIVAKLPPNPMLDAVRKYIEANRQK
jgi:uridine monophosphate synthetase